jgi:hypothetical protein
MDFLPRNNNGVLLPLYIQDLTSPIGAGLTGLSPNSPGLTCYYYRDVDASPTNIPLASLSPGIYTASGFASISDTMAPGDYVLGLPSIVSSGSQVYSTVSLYGAANMLPVKVKLILTDVAMGYIATSGISSNAYVPMVEPSSIPVWPMRLPEAISIMAARTINKTITATDATGSGGADIIYKSNNTSTIGSGVFSDNGTAFTRNKYQ